MADVFKTRTFARWARRERVADSALRNAVTEVEHGLIDANLGGHLIKKRVAAPGRGKRGGYRTIIACRTVEAYFFVFGFAKSERENLRNDELAALKKFGDTLVSFDERQISEAIEQKELMEVK